MSGEKIPQKKREEQGETDQGHFQARQTLPSDFSNGGVACELTTINFASFANENI